MPDILHDFPVFAPAGRVLDAVTTPAGLNAWWTVTSSGEPAVGSTWELGFGPEYAWRGVVRDCGPDRIEWELTRADDDWSGTRVGFLLEGVGDRTEVRFHHAGWAEANGHYRTSTFCWAMYLRLMKRFVEQGEIVPYAERLDA